MLVSDGGWVKLDMGHCCDVNLASGPSAITLSLFFQHMYLGEQRPL